MLSFNVWAIYWNIIPISLPILWGVCKVGVFASLSEKSERLESNEKNENEKNEKMKNDKMKNWERMELVDLGHVAFLFMSPSWVFSKVEV